MRPVGCKAPIGTRGRMPEQPRRPAFRKPYGTGTFPLFSAGEPCYSSAQWFRLDRHVRYLFEDYALDPDRRELLRGTTPVALEPQVFDLLLYLIQSREHVVSKDELIAKVWQGRIVSDPR